MPAITSNLQAAGIDCRRAAKLAVSTKPRAVSRGCEQPRPGHRTNCPQRTGWRRPAGTERLVPAAASREKPPAVETRTERAIGVDVCRVLAAFGVIWTHYAAIWETGGSFEPTNFGLFGVPFFIAVAVLFAMRETTRPAGEAVGLRFDRIIRPFAAWSLLYLGLETAKSWLLGSDSPKLSVEMLVQGPCYEYWFLPYVFLVTSGCIALASWLRTRPSHRTAVGALCLLFGLALYAVPVPFGPEPAPPYFLVRYWQELPVVLLSMGLVMLASSSSRFGKPSMVVAGGAGAVFLAATAWLLLVGRSTPIVHLSGLALVVFGLHVSLGGIGKRIACLGKHTYTVYLAHVIILWPFYSLARKVDEPGLVLVLAGSLLALALSLAASMVLRRFACVRSLVP